MRSSRSLNFPRKIGQTPILKRSFFLFCACLPLGILPQILLGTTSVWMFLAFAFLPGIASQIAFGRGEPFPDAALERFKIRLRKFMFDSQNRNCDVTAHPGADFKAEREERLCRFVGPGEVDTYAFKLTPASAVDPVDFYQSFYEELLGSVQQGVMIKDAVLGLDYQTDYIRTHRPVLIEKGICEQQRYLFITFEPTVSETTRTVVLKKIETVARSLTEVELSRYLELVAAPESPPTERSRPAYQVSQSLNGQHISMYHSRKVQGAASLCVLPEQVERDYNLILAPSISRHTVITTTFKFREGWRTTFRSLQKGFFNTSKLNNNSDVEIEENRERNNAAELGDGVELHMYQSILMYDDPERIHRRCLELQNVRMYQNLKKEHAPVYVEDRGFIEQSFRAALPSAWAYLPERLQDINSRREGSRYMPIEAVTPRKTSPLVFRTIRNTPYYVDIQEIADKVLVIIDGDTGTGKSTLITLYNKALIYLEEYEGIKVGFVSIDIGGTNAWVKDEEGVLSFDLADVDERGQSAPWPIHPLHCVLDPDRRDYSAEKLGLAAQYLCKIMKFKTHINIAKEAVIDAITEMVNGCKDYRLSSFLGCFEKQFEIFRAKDKLSEAMRYEWHEAVSILKRFSKGGIYGEIYDPDVTTHRNLDGIYRVYFNVDLAQERVKDLAGFHLQLGYLIGYSLCLRYSSTSGDYRLFHFYADEFKKQAEYIDAEEILELKNQSRKSGFLPFVCIQSFKHLLLDKLDPEKRREIFEGIREVWVGNVDFNEDRSKLATILNVEDPPRGQPLPAPLATLQNAIDFNIRILKQRKSAQSIQDPTDIEREVAKQYTIGYISQTREIVNLFVDIEPEWLWEVTTHAAGRELRAMVMKEFGMKKREAAKYLTRVLPVVPTAKLSFAELESVLGRIRREIKA